MRRRFLIFSLLAAAPAYAEDPPLIHPNRDVAVDYRSSGMAHGPADDPAGVITMRFSGQGNRIRIDGPHGHGYAILDIDSGRMTMVITDKQIYMEAPANPGMLAMFQAKPAAFRKTGNDTIAGVACTTYAATINDHDGQVCLTGDGVLLRARSTEPNGQRELEAVKVTYEAQPAELFGPPAGFKKMDVPDVSDRRPISGFGSPNAPRGAYMGTQNGR
jgi:hypothetical protein